MVRNILLVFVTILFLTSCSTLKPINFTANRQEATAVETTTNAGKGPHVRFIDNIAIKNEPLDMPLPAPKENKKVKEVPVETATAIFSNRVSTVESATSLQLKYAILLNTEVEELENSALLESIDEWYGTRYRMGGTTKSGVDCSAFVKAVFISAFAIPLPRTAREQHRASDRISRAELKEGDMVFFNTRGGVSHVGIYLQNNKFVHASTSRGVTISDLYDPYYVKRYVGAGRISEPKVTVITD